MKAEDVKTLVDLLLYCRVHAKQIYVRAHLGGDLKSWALAELPDDVWADAMAGFATKFILRGFVPHRVLTPEETSEMEKAKDAPKSGGGP